ncbi:MAG: DUF167 domain-containing protein [Gammaproteobacteria bacterium]|nr:DUF167 domain-containing protein [Gammaproteobacteria bacterium]
MLLRLRVQPRAHPEGAAGLHAGRLRLRVAAPPLDGRANARVIELLAELLNVPASTVELLHGQAGRDKDVVVRGAAGRIEIVRAGLDPPAITR